MSVTVRLADDLDVSRGQVIASPAAPPAVVRELVADVCWFDDRPLRAGGRYVLKAATRSTRATVADLLHAIDVDTLGRDTSATSLELNDIGRLRLRTAEPVALDPYAENRSRARSSSSTSTRTRRWRPGWSWSRSAPSSRRPARAARTSCATSPPSRASSAGPRSAAAAGPCGSPACRRRASRRSPRPSRRCSSAAGAPPTCSTATRCATA